VNASVEISVLQTALSAAQGSGVGADLGSADLLRFIHLRVHSEYSVSDSIVRIDSLVAAVKADKQPAVAITDLGNLFGWIKFYQAARSQGIQPICGVDCFVSNPKDRDRPHRILLLCSSPAGYRRLCQLLSRAWLENEYRGRGELNALWFDSGSNEGLICLSGGVNGELAHALISGSDSDAQATRVANQWAVRFPGTFYIEVQRSGAPEAETYTRLAAMLAADMGLPIVATHPVQFIKPEEFRAHEARVCIAEGEILANPRRSRKFTEEQYLKSQSQMAELFADLPSALANSVEIARRCAHPMILGKPQLPDFPTPDGITLDDYMRQLSHDGLQKRMLRLFEDPTAREAAQEQYKARLDYECDTIKQMGFAGYFLIVADFINWAKNNEVPVGPGRGSGAGSLVAFALGITDIDPIPYALLFERFLNPERVSMPDFDIDFCQDNRWRVIEYVRERYGADAVSQIATFGTMASKAVIRDAGRVLDMGYNFCDQLSKLIPVVQNKPLSLEKAKKEEPLLKERAEKEDEVRELFALAEPLEDLTRNVGMHAGGVLIAPGKLTDFCPLYKQPGSDTSVISQYDKDDVEAVGLVKFDFLGLRNLTIIDMAVRWINAHHKAGLELDRLTFDDQQAYQVLRDANTTAIFQVESDGMKKLLKKLQPDRFEDIIAVLALYRPGPLGSGMVDDFILRKKGQQKIDYFHPDLKGCLEPTYGVIVYQEQVMQIAQIIGGYTLGSADLLRRAMGKKKAEEMAEHRSIFVDGAKLKNYDEGLANKLFDLMAMFAEYGFNKSHTAAYAVVTYQTAWLKAKYGAEFMAATLSSDMDDTDKVQFFVGDTKANKIIILPPDINRSSYRFEPVDHDVPGPDGKLTVVRAVRYGLGGVKGSGESAVLNILKTRAEKSFRDLFDFCQRIDRKVVNRRAIEALIKAGAFDAVDDNRSKLLASVSIALELAETRAANVNQVSLFGDAVDVSDDASAEYAKVPRWTERQQLQEEKIALGFFLSGHLFRGFETEVRRFVRNKIGDLQPSKEPQWCAGIVTALRTQMTRRGKMVFVTLDDGTGAVDLALFNEVYEAKRQLVRVDELMIVHAKVSKDEYSGGQRVVAEQVLDLTTARIEFGKRVRIVLPDGGSTEAFDRLKAGLLPFVCKSVEQPGLDVFVQYQNKNALCELKLPMAWRVRPQDEFIATVHTQLRASIEKVSVAIEY
jgi:DNA polymerase III subunit alpha